MRYCNGSDSATFFVFIQAMQCTNVYFVAVADSRR